VIRPHGLKGELKVDLACSGIDRILTCSDLLLTGAGKEPRPVKAEMAFARPDGAIVVKLREVNGRDEAEACRGMKLMVPADKAAPAPEGSFYIHDLLGCRVATPAGEELGILEEVMETPANWVWAVRRNGREILVPALKSMVKKVDLKARRVVVDWPGEINEDNAD